MNNNPIGLFDSGVGGLTVLRALQEVIPHENFVYLGDTARLPYGTKSKDTIIRYALQCTAKLMERNLKLLVMACNTVSSVALPALQREYPQMNIIGVVESGAQAACLASKNGNIAILGTESTIQGKAYERAILNINPHAQITAKASPLFVTMAEEGLVEGPLVEGIVAYYLDEIFKNTKSKIVPDTLVLGCTHFPLLKKSIQNVVGDTITLVDSAQTTARAVYQLLKEHSLLIAPDTSLQRNITFLTTDDVNKFSQIGERFLGFPLKNNQIELVNL